MTKLKSDAERGLNGMPNNRWRVGTKVPLNVYDGERAVCQCHNPEDAARIVEAMDLYTLRHVDAYHEDYGTVLWWHVPVQEPPYAGAGPGLDERYADGEPTDCARLIEEGWLTHWSRLPNISGEVVDA